MFCLETAAQLRGQLERINEAGADLVFVGNGSVSQAKFFQQRRVPDCVVLTDPDRASYHALQLARGHAGTWGPQNLLPSIRANLSGHHQTWWALDGKPSDHGDPLQLGGYFVLAKGGRVLYEHRNRNAGDTAPVEEILGALEGE
ncbi:MAG: AhpC/TSA family protein [Candidatus Dormibacteria bacterium]